MIIRIKIINRFIRYWIVTWIMLDEKSICAGKVLLRFVFSLNQTKLSYFAANIMVIDNALLFSILINKIVF